MLLPHRLTPAESSLPDDVIVSRDVSYRLGTLSVDDPLIFCHQYLDILESGFFDAHHEPQNYFLKLEDGCFKPDILLYSLENLPSLLFIVNQPL